VVAEVMPGIVTQKTVSAMASSFLMASPAAAGLRPASVRASDSGDPGRWAAGITDTNDCLLIASRVSLAMRALPDRRVELLGDAEHHRGEHHDGSDLHGLFLLLAAPTRFRFMCLSDAAAQKKVAEGDRAMIPRTRISPSRNRAGAAKR
jgi:hypothetical protein